MGSQRNYDKMRRRRVKVICARIDENRTDLADLRLQQLSRLSEMK